MSQDKIKKIFVNLFPKKKYVYHSKINYSGKFKDYNANIRLRDDWLIISLSKTWKNIDKEILKGLIQTLLVKLFKEKKETTEMNIYTLFIKKLHLIVPKTKQDPFLMSSFSRVNNKFFYNTIEAPNLIWGKYSRTTLGHYNYHSDTITISKVFEKAPTELLDYVMYHETLHKKHSFSGSARRHSYHSKKFREDEKKFPNSTKIEKSINRYVSRQSILTGLRSYINRKL